MDVERTAAVLYSAPMFTVDKRTTAPNIACAPPTCWSARFTSADFSCELDRYPDTPAYGETAAHARPSPISLLATRSSPYTVNATSSGPNNFTKLVLADASHLCFVS